MESVHADWLNKLIYMKEYDADTDKVLWEECYSFAELRLDEEGEFVCREQIEPDESKLQQRRQQEMLEEKLEEERRLRLECGEKRGVCIGEMVCFKPGDHGIMPGVIDDRNFGRNQMGFQTLVLSCSIKRQMFNSEIGRAHV